MEISPIAGIRVTPVQKVPPADSDLSGVYQVENAARSGDDTYNGSGRKASGGQDDDDDAFELAEEDEAPAHGFEYGRRIKISYLA